MATTLLQPTDEIPDLLAGTAGPMMFLRAAIGGAPLSVGQGQEVPPAYAMLASGLAAEPTLTFLLRSVGLRLPRGASLAHRPGACRLLDRVNHPGRRTVPARRSMPMRSGPWSVLATYQLGVAGAVAA